jgi:hypothetical protein
MTFQTWLDYGHGGSNRHERIVTSSFQQFHGAAANDADATSIGRHTSVIHHTEGSRRETNNYSLQARGIAT